MQRSPSETWPSKTNAWGPKNPQIRGALSDMTAIEAH